MNKKLIAVLLVMPILILIIGQACSDTKLSRGQFSQASKGNIGFCTTPAQNIQSNLKYIFVFDHSGSNQQNYVIDDSVNPPAYLPDNGGSDQFGTKRYPPLTSFLSNIPDTEFTFYSVVNFSDQATVGLRWRNNAGVRTTSAQAITYLNNEQSRVPGPPPRPADGGGTNYVATLDVIRNMIDADVTAAKDAAANGIPIISSDYVIFWVSDGAPYVNGDLQELNTINGRVQSVLALRANDPDYINSITLNTGFYHVFHDPASTDRIQQLGVLQDQLSAQYMSAIANAGQGVFIDFQSAVIDYTKFSVPLRSVKYLLKDVWLQNANTVWWNGRLVLDADADALPDEVEATFASNLNSYDTDGNGAGDGVEYYLFGKPCADANCSTALAASYQQQCGPMPAGGYRDFDKDFLNDCEEKLLGSRFDDFDSNQDYVPDQFSWVNKVAFVAGIKDVLSDPDGDAVTNYFELKQNMPVQYSNAFVRGVLPMAYGASVISDNSSQTCYQLNVGYIATLTPQDTIRVYSMEARGAVGTNRKMRVAQKKIVGGNLVVTDGDFN